MNVIQFQEMNKTCVGLNTMCRREVIDSFNDNHGKESVIISIDCQM